MDRTTTTDKAPRKTIRNGPLTRRLDKHGRESKRWGQLMFFNVPRWIRCYDDGDQSIDRYTVVFSSLKLRAYEDGTGPSVHPYVSMNAAPFHPQGFGQHGESTRVAIDWPTYGHLGKKIVFADLPLDCQWLVLKDYCCYWHLDITTHPMFDRIQVGGFGISWRQGVKPWRAARPPQGKFDSRTIANYQAELRMTSTPVLYDLLAIIMRPFPTPDTIDTWEDADRVEVADWAASTYLAANENLVKIPPKPQVIIDWEAR